MHSIMVRSVDGKVLGQERVLARDISSSYEAWSIVESLAKSYPEHGIDLEQMVFWFTGRTGLHHIWAERSSKRQRRGTLAERAANLLSGEDLVRSVA